MSAPNADTGDRADACPWRHWLRARRRGDSRASRIGRHAGAARLDRGAYRPSNACVMNDGTDFCAVCREAVVLTIYTYMRPIDSATGNDEPFRLPRDGSLELEVIPFQPDGHDLKVSWILQNNDGTLPAARDGTAAGGGDTRAAIRNFMGRVGTRRGLGPEWSPPFGDTLTGIVKAAESYKVHVLTIDASTLDPGAYRVTAVVEDSCEWVLRDEENLLRDWRAWDVLVE